MDSPWRIEMFGGLQLIGDDGQVVSRFQTRKTAALLAYLAYYKEKPVSREVLADLFWPENDPEASRNSLRVALNSLRKQIEPPGIPAGAVLVADRSIVRLSPAAIVTDVAEFDRALKQERLVGISDEQKTAVLLTAVELYKGPLLSGWYEEWIDLEQTRLAEVYAGALRRLTSLLLAAGDYDRALDFARRAVQADPLREENHRHLMRLYASIGRPDAALKQFRELETVLRDEMGMLPSGVTRELVKQIAALPQSGGPLLFDVRGGQTTGEERTAAAERRVAAGDRRLPPTGETTSPPEKMAVVAEEAAPPLPFVPSSLGSVPLQFTRFFGREDEIARLVNLLDPAQTSRPHLITLTGPGGTGKTRLSVEVATRLRQNEYAGRVWVVPLADLTEAAQIAPAVAGVLRLAPVPDESPMEQIIGALGELPSLLVLDNFEQIVQLGASWVQSLLEAVPTLSCLVTSRHRLDLGGEREIPLSPLPTPPPSAALSSAALEELCAYPSVALFIDRAQAVRPDFQITPRSAPAIALLCARLDGLPLAIELVAAWSRLLTPAQMVERLSERFDLLVSERRDLSPRHRSLRAVMDESYRLMPEEVCPFFAAVSVFRGGWTLDAAQTICGCADALELLDLLQRRSLVVASENENGIRFHMLETVREYAGEKLPLASARPLAQAHAAYFARLAQNAAQYLSGPQAETWRVKLDDDHDNLRAALHFFLHHRPQESLALASAMWRFWYARGYAEEGIGFLERVLREAATIQDAPLPLLASALHGAGRLALSTGNATRACDLFAQSLSALEGAKETETDRGGLSRAMAATDLGIASQARGDAETAFSAYQIVLAQKREAGDPWGVACALSEIGASALTLGRGQVAYDALLEGAELRWSLGDGWGAAEADLNRAQAMALLHQENDANALKASALHAMNAMGDVCGIAASFLNLGYVASEQGDYETALPLLQDALSLHRTLDDASGAALTLLVIAQAALEENDLEFALQSGEEAMLLRWEADRAGENRKEEGRDAAAAFARRLLTRVVARQQEAVTATVKDMG